MAAANIMQTFGDVSNVLKTHQKKSGGQHAQILEQPQRQPWTPPPVSNCVINYKKGNCVGDCPEPGESCVHYQVVDGGSDPWPNQRAYVHEENKTSWKCNCMTSQADGIDEEKLETNITRDDLELLTVLDFDGKLENLFQKRITNDMKTTFQRLAKGDPNLIAYSDTDCAFSVLNYLKLVPRKDLNKLQQTTGCSDARFLEILQFFHRNRDNIFYEFFNFAHFRFNMSPKEAMERIEMAIRNNHAAVLIVHQNHVQPQKPDFWKLVDGHLKAVNRLDQFALPIHPSYTRHVQILEKTDGGVLRLVDPQHNFFVEGLDKILDSFKSNNVVPHMVLLQYHIPKSFLITSHWTKRLFEPSEPPHNKNNFRFVSDDEQKEYKEFLKRPKYRFSPPEGT